MARSDLPAVRRCRICACCASVAASGLPTEQIDLSALFLAYPSERIPHCGSPARPDATGREYFLLAVRLLLF
jgi:hypothetical protein